MEVLKPFTISNSLVKAPTKLLTQDFEIYLVFKPIDEHSLIQVNILMCLLNHFKITYFKTASFNYKEKRYLCLEQTPDAFDFSVFYNHLWSDKKSFNQFLNPEELLKIELINLLFPIFHSKIEIQLRNNKKFIFSATLEKMILSEPIQFQPISINQTLLNEPAIKKFINYKKREMNELMEAFEILHHDKLMADLKYQISMNSQLRNEYWNELKKCFDPSFKKFIFSTIKDYLLRI